MNGADLWCARTKKLRNRTDPTPLPRLATATIRQKMWRAIIKEALETTAVNWASFFLKKNIPLKKYSLN